MFKSLIVMMMVLGSYVTPTGWGFSEELFAPTSGLEYMGKVKAIGVEPKSGNVRVRLMAENPAEVNQVQVFKLCHEPRQQRLNFRKDLVAVEGMKLLREAMRTGAVVTVKYNSIFRRCITGVDLLEIAKGEVAKKKNG